VPSEEAWPKTDTQNIDPPVFKMEKDRKQTKRRKGKFEVPSPRDNSRMSSITYSKLQEN
jgi:hypothetical protein